MSRDHCAVLLAAWVFWGVPTFCVAGVIEHACAPADPHCDDELDAHGCSHEQPDCPHDFPSDGGCGHESDCGSDPCYTAVVGRERSGHDTLTEAVELLPTVLRDDDHRCGAGSLYTVGIPTFPGARIPLHHSDVPLLI